jgi:sugar/nucleoside kinase (ribokinase family)
MLRLPIARNIGSVQVVGVGAATLDDIWLVDRFLSDEGVHQALGHLTSGGGPVATSLCVLSRLGHKTALIDSCGDDPAGREILAGLSAAGVHTTGIQCTPKGISATAIVLVRAGDGARQIVYQPSSAAEPRLDSTLIDMIAGARLLHLNGRHESTARACVEIAQGSDLWISFDGGAGRYRDSIRDLVEASHLRLLSKDFAMRFTGLTDIAAMMSHLLSGVAKVAVITDGLGGSYMQCLGGEMFHQSAYPNVKTIDSTGCGDVFHGAFLHGYLSHWEIRRCADFASRVASINASGLGGRYVLNAELDLLTP